MSSFQYSRGLIRLLTREPVWGTEASTARTIASVTICTESVDVIVKRRKQIRPFLAFSLEGRAVGLLQLPLRNGRHVTYKTVIRTDSDRILIVIRSHHVVCHRPAALRGDVSGRTTELAAR